MDVDLLDDLFREIFGYILIFVAALGIITFVFRLLIAYGLLTFRRWAWVLALAFELFNILGYCHEFLRMPELEMDESFSFRLMLGIGFYLMVSAMTFYILCMEHI